MEQPPQWPPPGYPGGGLFRLQGYSPVYSVILHLVEVSVNSTVILRGGTGIARGALLGVSALFWPSLLGNLLVNLLADGQPFCRSSCFALTGSISVPFRASFQAFGNCALLFSDGGPCRPARPKRLRRSGTASGRRCWEHQHLRGANHPQQHTALIANGLVDVILAHVGGSSDGNALLTWCQGP